MAVQGADGDAHVAKALNTIVGHVLAHGTPLDAFVAGDSVDVRATVTASLDSLGLRTLEAGPRRSSRSPSTRACC